MAAAKLDWLLGPLLCGYPWLQGAMPYSLLDNTLLFFGGLLGFMSFVFGEGRRVMLGLGLRSLVYMQTMPWLMGVVVFPCFVGVELAPLQFLA